MLCLFLQSLFIIIVFFFCPWGLSVTHVGMENVGNTTILSSKIAPSDLLTDPEIVYMEGVKAHEMYHDINGSQVRPNHTSYPSSSSHYIEYS